MNWDAVGAIAEAIASFGVIISLVYLAVHNRKQTVDNSLATGSELANQIIDMSGSLADNKDLSSLFLKGLRDLDSLDPTEMLQFSAFCNRLIRIADVMRSKADIRLECCERSANDPKPTSQPIQ